MLAAVSSAVTTLIKSYHTCTFSYNNYQSMYIESYYEELTVDDVTIVHHAHHQWVRAREMAAGWPLSIAELAIVHHVHVVSPWCQPSLTIPYHLLPELYIRRNRWRLVAYKNFQVYKGKEESRESEKRYI